MRCPQPHDVGLIIMWALLAGMVGVVIGERVAKWQARQKPEE